LVYRNLMAKDEFKNLGFGDDKPAAEDKKDGNEKGKKGELRW
jgi:cytochrome c oxidase assembly protein subunit 19